MVCPQDSQNYISNASFCLLGPLEYVFNGYILRIHKNLGSIAGIIEARSPAAGQIDF